MHYRTRPAVLLAQFARATDTPGVGEEMLQHADSSARRALRYVGATVLVVDPFDQDTAEMWQQRFGFKTPSRQCQATASYAGSGSAFTVVGAFGFQLDQQLVRALMERTHARIAERALQILLVDHNHRLVETSCSLSLSSAAVTTSAYRNTPMT